MAESARAGACSTGATQDCTALASTARSEASLYQTLQERYRLCLQRSRIAYPFTDFGFSAYTSGLLFDPLQLDVEYQ